MNSKQAKNLSIFDFLKSQGINPKHTKGNKAFYVSPFRSETKASFNVDVDKNIWYDYGTGEGGRIIDLVTKMFNISVSQALNMLLNTNISNNNHFFSFYQQNSNTAIKIQHIQPIQNKALIQYLTIRKIPLNIAKTYLKEVYYNTNNKKYFALGFKNDKGGHELRNKYFKGSTSPKHYTSIKNNATSLNIFEGFFDFLTALAYFKTVKPGNDTIILNSLAFLDKIIPKLKSYKRINLYFDNDKAGQKAVELIIVNHSLVINQAAKIYPNHKDFNEYYKTQILPSAQ